MIEGKVKVATAMFDIKPVDDSGNIDVSKIYNIQSILNLGRKFKIGKTGLLSVKSKISSVKQRKPEPYIKKPGVLNSKDIVRDTQTDPAKDMEKYINEDINPMVELAAIGAEFHNRGYSKPRHNARIKNNELRITNGEQEFLGKNQNSKFIVYDSENKEHEDDYQLTLAQINQKIPSNVCKEFIGEPKKIDTFSLGILTQKAPQEVQASKELDMWVKDFSKKPPGFTSKVSKASRTLSLVVVFGLFGLTFFGYYGSNIKNQLIVEGNSAVANLENAGENIKNMDFVSASSNFAQAYQEFSKAGDGMNFMGTNVSSLLSDLPGAGKLKSAKNLVEAGKLMANAGQAMSDAMGEIAKTNLILLPTSQIGNKNVQNQALNIGIISASLKKALVLSQKNLKNAKALLADTDILSIPEDKRASLEEFNSKLPLFEELIDDFVGYSRFLEDFIGTKGIKKYLILFQNPSELRPTGGFPGTYGVVAFKDGKLQDFKVDDVYNLDGQLQELVIPPAQLQHITPNWGMRDANWFIDFPTSARKITSFFKKESGYDVDGVITFSPQIVARILKIVGPIEMPDYNLIIDSDNLFYALQEEVEYKGDRKQPKQIIMDFAPRMLEKLYSIESSKWLDVFNILVSSMEQKDILMYFRDLNLQSFSVDKGFSGKVADTNSDYLMVVFSNVKGSKTDLVVDSSFKMQATTENGNIKHKISITRTHNGGDSKYGFYNKQSPAFVRVLVPKDAEFTGLTGNSKPNFKPLIDYADSGFRKDEDLAKFEKDSYFDSETGVTIYGEAGKTEYGFWMIINPGETKTADLEYTTPLSDKDYQFYLQKQPGLEVDDFQFSLDGKMYFEGRLEKDLIITPY